jgi:hypothetical protein
MRTFKFVLLGTAVLIIVVVIYLGFGNYSDGFRAGTMVKFSKKGIVVKTFEGQLNLGMVLSDEPGRSPTSVGNLWEFTVPSGETEVIKTLEHALLTGKRVKLHYNEKFFTLFWRGDTKYMVDQAEIVE